MFAKKFGGLVLGCEAKALRLEPFFSFANLDLSTLLICIIPAQYKTEKFSLDATKNVRHTADNTLSETNEFDGRSPRRGGGSCYSGFRNVSSFFMTS